LIAAFAILLSPLSLSLAHAAGSTSRADSFFIEAQKLFENGKYRSAEIQLKNALQRDAGHLPARRLLGELYLKLENGASAEKELVVARNRGASDLDLPVLIARAQILQGRLEDVLKTLADEPSDTMLRAETLLLRGQALVGLKRFPEAEVALTESERLRPDDLRARVGLAHMLVGKGMTEDAEREVDTALARAPDLKEALILKGELRRFRRDPEAAVRYFAKVTDADPDNVAARIGRAGALFELNRDDEAERDVEVALRRHPKHPIGSYLAAVGQFRKKNYAGAKESLVQVERQLADYLPAVLLMANVAFALNQLEQAASHLERYVSEVPGNDRARRLLGAVLVRQRAPARAIEVLKPLLAEFPNDGNLLSDIAGAYMMLGKIDEATDFYRRASEAAPEQAQIKTRLAYSQMVGGRLDDAIETLEKTLEDKPDAAQAGVLLTLAKLRQGDHDGAIESATQLQKQDPKSPLASNLLGAAYLGKGDVAAARRHFEHALQVRPDFHTARMNLAQIDIRQGKLADARQKYEAILAADARNVPAMLALAQLAEREGRADKTVNWLQRAAEAKPADVDPPLRLVAHYTRIRDFARALATARDVDQRFPANRAVLETLGRTELAAGQASSAVHTFRRLAGSVGETPEVLGLIAGAQIAARDIAGAKATLQSALEKDPDNVQTKMMVIEVETRDGDLAVASRMATELRAAHPEAAAADMLIGDVRMREKRFDDAVAAYEAGLAKADTSVLAIRRFAAQQQAGRSEEAIAQLQTWVDRTGDRSARQVLANTYLSLNRLDDSLREGEKLYEVDKSNATLLNNLAWIYHQRGNERALELAEQAHKLSPRSPEIMDTLGWIYVEKGQPERGMALLRSASELAPTQGDILYHYAVALHKTGRTSEARRELEKLLRSEQRFGKEKEARQLLRSLAGS
jgi:putative PEP-CTERM system TPR-repeat lipoprotein